MRPRWMAAAGGMPEDGDRPPSGASSPSNIETVVASRAVRPQQRDRLATADVQAQGVHRAQRAETLVSLWMLTASSRELC